jgi:hypothetical protein
MPYAYFTLVKFKAPRGRFLRWEEYSLTFTPQFSYLWYKGVENSPNEIFATRLTHRSFLLQLA